VVEFRILGPVEVVRDGATVALPRPRPRALLALLLLHANEVVSAERLIDALWGDKPPRHAQNALQATVSRLRKQLDGPETANLVRTRAPGYAIEVERDALDLARFERLVEQGRDSLRGGGAASASLLLAEALDLWRGPALSDLAPEGYLRREASRLDEERSSALELRIEADLACGRHAALVGELEALVGELPYREGLRAQLMLALYRSGRQAEALTAYQDGRRLLVDELGIEPSRALQDLERSILTQDPTLELPAALSIATTRPSFPAALELGSPILAGRDSDLDWLRAAWRDARSGAGSVRLLSGPEGIGKTRLCAAVARLAYEDGAVVLYRSFAGSSDREDILPQHSPASRPTVLVLDDLHAAGESVLAEVRRLSREAHALPLLVVGAFSTVDGQPGTDLGELASDPGLAHRELGPLGRRAVQEIVALYLEQLRNRAALEEILAGSGGVPRLVHELGAQYAEAEARSRLGAVLAAAVERRTGLDATRSEVENGVAELQRVRERARFLHAEHEAGEAGVVCPFKGLTPFGPQDADYFFGRERLLAELVARLVGTRFLCISGPSGSGKSSLLRAGLLPALAGGVIPGSERRHQVVFRPGAHPLEALARTREDPAGGERLLAVDQLEEVFTLCDDPDERRAFVHQLVEEARDERQATLVVAAVRADFIGHCAAYPGLASLLSDATVLVGPMTEEELRSTIERPAARSGLTVEPGLTDTLVAETLAEPGGLPLLQSALIELWQHRHGRSLTLRSYARTGGVRGAVARIADETFDRLSPTEQDAARNLLLRLAEEGPGSEVVRRRVAPAELDADREDVRAALSALVDARLVVASEGSVEVAHEALFREWPRLRLWLEEDAQGRSVRRAVTATADAWERGGRDPGELLRGARLASTLEWTDSHDAGLNRGELEFLEASQVEAERDARRQRRANRRLRGLLAGVVVLLALSLLAGLLALRQRGRANGQARAAEAEKLGARALTEPRLDLALLLARQGDALDPSTETYGNLLAAELRAPAAVAVMRPWDGLRIRPGVGTPSIPYRETCVDVSPDGNTLAAGDMVGGLVLLNPRTYARRGQVELRLVTCRAHAFSPNSSTFATIAWAARETRFRVALVDVASRTVRGAWLGKGRRPTGALAYSPDGRAILTVEQASSELVLVRRNAATGRPLGPGVPVTRRGWRFDASRPVSAWVGYTADGTKIVLSAPPGAIDAPSPRGRTLVLDARTLLPLRSFAVGSDLAALSPDGGTLALGRLPQDDQVTLLDLRTGARRQLHGRQRDAVQGVGFSPDGTFVVTGGSDGSAIVWESATGELHERLEGHTGAVFAPAFAPDGRTVFTVGLDQSVIAWDLAGGRGLGRPFEWAPAGEPQQGGEFVGTALSPDGTVLYRGSPDGRVLALGVPDGRLRWDATVWSRARTLRLLREEARALKWSVEQLEGWVFGGVPSVAVDPQGTTLATADDLGEVALLDAATGAVLRRWQANVVRGDAGPEYVNTVAFTADGRDLVTANDDGRAVIWDVATGKEIAAVTLPPNPSRYVLAALPSPDGRELALLTGPNVFVQGPGGVARVGVWSIQTGKPLWERDIGLDFWEQPGLAASPDWSLLATVGFFREVRLWDIRSGNPVGNPIPAGEGFVISASFDPTGRRLLTGGTDGTARVFDVATHEQVGASLPGTASWWTEALFGPDGTTVLTLSGAGRATWWDLAADRLRAQACRTANRVLTDDEWRRFLPGRRYAPACRAP
jgi:DNA-binding SARP family transcriptional activator/WD40 repeat protein